MLPGNLNKARRPCKPESRRLVDKYDGDVPCLNNGFLSGCNRTEGADAEGHGRIGIGNEKSILD